jgi:hypothetical protein
MSKKNPSNFLNYKSPREHTQKNTDDSKLSSRSRFLPKVLAGITSGADGGKSTGMSDLLDKINDEKQQQELKEIVEFKNIHYKALNIIEGTLELLDDKATNTLEEGEKYELVETNLLRRQRKDNESLKNSKIELVESYNDMVNGYNKTTKDLLATKDDYNHQEEQKGKNSNELYDKTESLKEIYIQSHKVMDMITKEQVEKDNVLRALIKLVDHTKLTLPKELKEIHKKFNNEYYGYSTKPDKSKRNVETLKENISKLEKDLDTKIKELDKVKTLLNINNNDNNI